MLLNKTATATCTSAVCIKIVVSDLASQPDEPLPVLLTAARLADVTRNLWSASVAGRTADRTLQLIFSVIMKTTVRNN